MTEIIKTIAQLRGVRSELYQSNKTVGFVPTMGYLHAGHQSLIKRACQENDYVIVSDFLNPLQFGPSEDLSKYPRDLEKDMKSVAEMGASLLFYPSATEMYGEDYLERNDALTTVIPPKHLTNKLCGLKRPGHFEGVCTVVNKLFNIVEPHIAYFGQKDAQQLVIIRKMVSDMNRNIEIVGCDIVRESDGLAMSSRNIYLNSAERNAALVLYRSLQNAQMLADQKRKNGENIDTAQIIRETVDIIKSEPLAKIDYVSLVDPETLVELSTKEPEKQGLLALAVYIGEDMHKTRLIDNVVL